MVSGSSGCASSFRRNISSCSALGGTLSCTALGGEFRDGNAATSRRWRHSDLAFAAGICFGDTVLFALASAETDFGFDGLAFSSGLDLATVSVSSR